LVKMAEDAAVAIVKKAYNAAKNWLLPGSPSRRWAELGDLSATGFAKGLDDDISSERSAISLAKRTTISFQKALDDAAMVMEQAPEFNPAITPVLDLTGVRAAAGEISGLIPATTLNTGISLQTAQTLASETRAREEAEADDVQETSPRELNLTQNNYSPETLNTAKIHKQTRSLIVLTKEELDIP